MPLNLRDKVVDVIGLYECLKSADMAREDGFYRIQHRRGL